MDIRRDGESIFQTLDGGSIMARKSELVTLSASKNGADTIWEEHTGHTPTKRNPDLESRIAELQAEGFHVTLSRQREPKKARKTAKAADGLSDLQTVVKAENPQSTTPPASAGDSDV